jgi:hypothetical protein
MPGEVTAAAVGNSVRAVLAPGSSERAAAEALATEIAMMPSAANVARDLESTTNPREALV